jgi:hypothetical protein
MPHLREDRYDAELAVGRAVAVRGRAMDLLWVLSRRAALDPA